MNKEEVLNYEAQTEVIKVLTSVWSTAYHGYDYRTYNIRVSSKDAKVYFVETPCTSGMHTLGSMPIEYLWREEELKNAAKAAGIESRAKRDKEFNEKQRLESSPDVIRWKEIQRSSLPDFMRYEY